MVYIYGWGMRSDLLGGLGLVKPQSDHLLFLVAYRGVEEGQAPSFRITIPGS